MSLKPTSVPSKTLVQNLASDGMVLYPNNLLGWDNEQLSAANFGSQLFIALRNPSNSQVEFIEVDPDTIDADNAVTILKRGLDYDGGQVANAAPAYDWNSFETIIEFGTATPQILKDLTQATNDEEITGDWHVPYPADPDSVVPKSYVDAAANAGAVPATTLVNGIAKLSVAPASAPSPVVVGDNDPRVPTQDENDGLGVYSPATANPVITKSKVRSLFGGTGADGALNTTSAPVSIDLGGAAVVVKNYTTITVATNNLTFTNPHPNGTLVILKATGNVTISATIDLSGMGAAGGAAKVSTGGGDNGAGNPGSIANGYVYVGTSTPNGKGGVFGGSAAAVGGIAGPKNLYATSEYNAITKGLHLVPGNGGGGGCDGSNTSISTGAGGNGGGALLIECGGALSFSGTINVSGANGTAGASGGGSGSTGSGGGGSAGMAVLVYNTLTLNSGTINSAGGAGGTHPGGAADTSTGGGSGAASTVADGGVGGNTGSGASAPTAGTGAGAGGGGAGPAVASVPGGAGGASSGGLVIDKNSLL